MENVYSIVEMSDTNEQRIAASLRNVAKYVYWIVGLIAIGGISYFFYNTLNKQIAAVLFFICGVIGLYFYYVKWFLIPERKPAWSPTVTNCPDYLTMYGTPATDGTYKCVDFVGVSKNARLKQVSPTNVDALVNNPEYFFPVDPKEQLDGLRTRLLAYGLTWSTLVGN
jgi:hypothetical protein